MRNLLIYMEKSITFIGAFALAALIIVSFLQVVCRYVFNNALNWPEEMCRYLFIIAAYFGAVLTMKHGSHLRVDILLTFSGPCLQKILNAVTWLGSLVYCSICGWASWSLMLDVQSLGQMSASMPLPVWLTWLPLPIGFLLMVFYAAVQLFRLFVKNDENTNQTV